MKNARISLLGAILFGFGFFGGHQYAHREAWLEGYYANGFLRWSAPRQLSQVLILQTALLQDKQKVLEGAVNDLTVHTLIDAYRALEISDAAKAVVPVRPPEPNMRRLIDKVALNAAKLNVKPLFKADTILPLDSQWDPLNPPGFEIGRYFDNLMQEPRKTVAAETAP